jgi:hypothetical protein
MKQFVDVSSPFSKISSMIPSTIFCPSPCLIFQDSDSFCPQDQTQTENENLYHSLFYLGKSFFFGFEIQYSPFEALSLFPNVLK